MRGELVEALRQLVRIPSVTGNEGPAQEYVRSLFEELDLEVISFEADRDEVKRHQAYVDSQLDYGGRPNVIGLLKGDPRKRSIILNGHVDTATGEPVEEWERDPWGGTVEGNRLYGRGALDMKGGLIANIFALKTLIKLGLDPGGTVTLQSVIEEEAGGGGGTLACFLKGYTADGMIVTEPYPYICIARSGLIYFRIKVEGKTAHGGRAHHGVNAIGKMLKLYQALEKLDQERSTAVKFPLIEKWSGRSCNLSISRFSAGSWLPNTIAGNAEMEGRVSFVPGENRQDIRRQIETVVQEVAAGDPWLRDHPPLVEYFSFQTDPEENDLADPFVKTVISSASRIMGGEVTVEGRPSAADTRFSKYFGFPALSIGPDGDKPHGADEYVDLDSVETITKLLALAVLSWCGGDKS